MRWVKIGKSPTSNEDVFGCLDDDNLIRVTCLSNHPEYLAWLAEGNTAEEWNTEETE